MTDTTSDDEAERLRLQGNDAFSTKDWKRAVDLYQRSTECGGSKNAAKTYSNLAATLCKLSRFEEASHAAERATAVDPAWGKGWWRRGVVEELRKFFHQAHQYYSIAVELEPNQAAFRNSLKDLEERLEMNKASDGTRVVNSTMTVTPEQAQKIPSKVAWSRFLQLSNDEESLDSYIATQDVLQSSEQWLVQGILEWISAMRNGVAQLATSIDREAAAQYQAILQQRLPDMVERTHTVHLLGGIPTGHSLDEYASGFAHLGGIHIALETGGTSPDDTADGNLLFCPQPRVLSHIPTYQNLALLLSVVSASQIVQEIFGKKMRSSQAVLDASKTFFTNIGRKDAIPKGGKPASPVDCVRYAKQQLQAGKTWDGGVRRYISLQYRGTMLYACLLRLCGILAEAYKWEKWAREFIDTADREFKVTEQNAYQEKGSAFRQTLRIGMLMSELQTLNVLRGEAVNGPYSMEMSMDLCTEIISRALAMETVPMPQEGFANVTRDAYIRIEHDVAFRRKPLALAHSCIASQLNTLQAVFGPEEFNQIAAHHGLIESQDCHTDPFALIAKHYRLAAEAELFDAEDCAVYWWGYAASMAQAETDSGFTLGELRSAIFNGDKAEDDRDVGLFGVNPERGGTFETIAKLTAEHYKEQADSCVLEKVELVRPSLTDALLRIGDLIICSDFAKYERRAREVFCNRESVKQQAKMDTCEINKKFGPGSDELVPSLETLCIRELHKAGYEHASGESDGAVIHYKAMMAAKKQGDAANE